MELVEESIELFLAEALKNCEVLNYLFKELEKDTENISTLNAIFKITCKLKENTMGFAQIAELGFVMEDTFRELKKGNIKLDFIMFKSLFKANVMLKNLIIALDKSKNFAFNDRNQKIKIGDPLVDCLS